MNKNQMKKQSELASTSPYTDGQTDYQVYVRILKPFTLEKNIIDFTERKLLEYIRQSKNAIAKMRREDLLSQYKLGEVAISWKNGIPYFILTSPE